MNFRKIECPFNLYNPTYQFPQTFGVDNCISRYTTKKLLLFACEKNFKLPASIQYVSNCANTCFTIYEGIIQIFNSIHSFACYHGDNDIALFNCVY